MLSFKGNLGSEAKTAERTELLVLCSGGIKKTVFTVTTILRYLTPSIF